MKKYFSVFLAILMLFLLFLPAMAVILGDYDKDGRVSAADARLILRMSVGLERVRLSSE